MRLSVQAKMKKPILKKCLIFFQKRFPLNFRKCNFIASSLKNSYIFSKKNFSYISGGNFQSPKNKNNPLWRNFLYYSKRVFPHFGMTADQAIKLKIPSYSKITAD